MAIHQNNRLIGKAVIYFALSAAITWYFIYCGASLYHFDMQKMLLSCSIAGAKWGIQILAALMMLKDKRWLFINRIGFTCYVGSCVLLPFCFGPLRNILPGNAFLLSLIAAVLLMIVLYYRSVRYCEISIIWFFSWLACLATAITLQLTVVFHVF